MAMASWNGQVLANSNDITHVEGNAYFPISTVDMAALRENPDYGTTFCHWKGHADYYDVVVGDQEIEAAAWIYKSPYNQAQRIHEHIAFWREVDVVGTPEGRGYVEPLPSLRDGKTGWEALCWLLRHPPKTELDPTDILENTDISESNIREVWEIKDVRRYAKRYRWTFKDEGDRPRLVQSPGEPVSID
jgi:uncharacterized protein (DUF427 family)|tara:strand:+ start:5052 stop:5618 length:567 start_codon:yes stop_codon:yes gene_type:complete